jgi:DNA-binding SARP family transcriptional activator
VFRILTLGGLTVESTERPAPMLQARLQGLGLLARLAVAGERGVSRDKLVGYFWPEKDERSALHSLSQALHRVKTELGSDTLVAGTRILRLDPEQISSDATDLTAAHANGDDARTVDLYSGPFLDGIFFNGAPEFERWIEETRQRFADYYAGALRRLAAAATREGDHASAARWRKQLLATDPLDGRLAFDLVQALAAADDLAGAQREARLHQALVRAELQTEPDPRISEFLDRHERGNINGTRPPVARVVSSRGPPADVDVLTADELCARARQFFLTLTELGIVDGIRYARRAIELEPQNAQAHVTLGWLFVILSQATRTGNAREQGAMHARRAAELDPDLVDVPLALAWIGQLNEDFEDADSHACRAVAMQPTYPMAHYILGWVRLNYALRRGCWNKCFDSVESLSRALEMNARDPHSLMGLASMYMLDGAYDAAQRALDRLVDMELAPVGDIRMIGGFTMRGLLRIRRGEWDQARDDLQHAIADYSNAPQIFTPYVLALTQCAMGDLERRVGRYDEAVACYVRALAQLDRMPELIGAGYLAVRLETRLAVSFRRLFMLPETERHARNATRLTATRSTYCFNFCWGVSEPEMHYDWAVYHAACGDRAAMLNELRAATDHGWREFTLLDHEPAFASYHGDPEVAALRERASNRPSLPSFQHVG